MALQFTYVGRQLILHNMFGFDTGVSPNRTYIPTLAGDARDAGMGNNLCIHFYGGTRPDISELPVQWQGTAYTGSTKLYPIGSSFSTIDAFLQATNGSGTTRTNPTAKLTIDWTNNKVTTPTTGNIASNIFMDAGTITWYAIYAGLGSASGTGTTWSLAWTGSVGVTDSGADIEFNRVDIPSSSYPINFEKMSFAFPQVTGTDVTFAKNIYTTALANIIGAGADNYYFNSSNRYNFHQNMTTSASANTRYVNGGSTANMIQFYNGTRPNSPDEAVPAGNTLIGSVNTILLNWDTMTRVNTSSEVSLAASGTWLGSAVAVGNPNWCRIMSATSSGYAAIDCSAGLPGSDAVVIYQDPITAIGQSINVTSVKFTLN